MMSNWDFDVLGTFGSEEDARRWADRNGLAHQDVHIRASRRGVDLEVRRAALGDGGARAGDLRDGRRTGW